MKDHSKTNVWTYSVCKSKKRRLVIIHIVCDILFYGYPGTKKEKN